MDSEKICLASKTIELSEHDNYLELTNRLCYYDDCNLNNVLLPFKNVEDDAKEIAQTLLNMPLQAKYKKIKNKDDFGGHEMKINKDGEVTFGTASIGTHTKVWISEPEEVITVKGEKKKLPCLYAVARVWKRNKNIISAIKRLFESEDGLNSSWEIATHEYKYANGIKTLTDYEFLANTCLGSKITPAYAGTSETISISSEMLDGELLIAEALAQDIKENDVFGTDENEGKKEENSLKKDNLNLSSKENDENVGNTVAEETPVTKEASENSTTEENTPTTSEDSKEDKKENDEESAKCEGGDKKKTTKADASETEVSQLTVRDLRRAVEKECMKKTNDYCYVEFMFPEEKEVWVRDYNNCEKQLDYLKFTYSVDNDVVTVSEPEEVTMCVAPREINTTVSEYEKQISEKDELILKSSQTITELNAQITELSEYKTKFEKSEQEKVEAELAEKKETLISDVVKSGQITREEIEKSEEMKGLVDSLDKKSLMAIIGERLLASVDEKETTIETSESKESVVVSTNLNNEDEEEASVSDKVEAFRKFLTK